MTIDDAAQTGQEPVAEAEESYQASFTRNNKAGKKGASQGPTAKDQGSMATDFVGQKIKIVAFPRPVVHHKTEKSSLLIFCYPRKKKKILAAALNCNLTRASPFVSLALVPARLGSLIS